MAIEKQNRVDNKNINLEESSQIGKKNLRSPFPPLNSIVYSCDISD